MDLISGMLCVNPQQRHSLETIKENAFCKDLLASPEDELKWRVCVASDLDEMSKQFE